MARNTKTLLLAAAQALFDGCTDDGIRLGVQAKARNEIIHTLLDLLFRNMAMRC